MAYVYESIQNGIVNFTTPGTGKTVALFKGSRITVDQPLSGGYLRVLRLIEEIAIVPPVEEVKVAGNSKAKVADKITKVEEVIEPSSESAKVDITDTEPVIVETAVCDEDPLPADAVTTPMVTEKKNLKKR